MLPVTSQNKTQSIWRRFTGLGGGQAKDKNWVCKTQKWDWSFKNCRASSWGGKCWEVSEVQCCTGSSNQQRNCSLEDYRAYRTSKKCPTSTQKEQINGPFFNLFLWALESVETLFVMGSVHVVQGIQTVRRTLRLKIAKHVRLYGQRLQKIFWWTLVAVNLHLTVVKPGPRTLKQGLWFRALKLVKWMHKYFIRNDR